MNKLGIVSIEQELDAALFGYNLAAHDNNFIFSQHHLLFLESSDETVWDWSRLLVIIHFEYVLINVLLHRDHTVDGLEQAFYLALLVFLRLQDELGFTLPIK